MTLKPVATPGNKLSSSPSNLKSATMKSPLKKKAGALILKDDIVGHARLSGRKGTSSMILSGETFSRIGRMNTMMTKMRNARIAMDENQKTTDLDASPVKGTNANGKKVDKKSAS